MIKLKLGATDIELPVIVLGPLAISVDFVPVRLKRTSLKLSMPVLIRSYPY